MAMLLLEDVHHLRMAISSIVNGTDGHDSSISCLLEFITLIWFTVHCIPS
jgi:hypothetical protein